MSVQLPDLINLFYFQVPEDMQKQCSAWQEEVEAPLRRYVILHRTMSSDILYYTVVYCATYQYHCMPNYSISPCTMHLRAGEYYIIYCDNCMYRVYV